MDGPREERPSVERRLPTELLHGLPDALVVTDRATRIEFLNARAEVLLGASLQDLLARHFFSLLEPADRRMRPRPGEVEPFRAGIGEDPAGGGSPLPRPLAGPAVHGYLRGDAFLMLEVSSSPVSYAGRDFVLHTVRDVSEVKRGEQELRRRARQQSAVAELGIEIIKSGDLTERLDDACERLRAALDVDAVGILELLPGGRSLLLRYGAGWQRGRVGRAVLGSGSSSLGGYALTRDGPVTSLDLRTESRFDVPRSLLEHGIVSSMSTVIYSREGRYGVLGVHSRTRRQFTDDDANVLQAVANLVAQTIGRYRAEERLRLRNRELTTSYQALEGKATAKGLEARALARELDAVSFGLRDLANTSSHDLRTPLRAIDGYAALLQQEQGDRIDRTGHEYIERIRDGANRIGRLLDAVVELAGLAHVAVTPRELDLSALVREHVRVQRGRNPGRNVEVLVGDGMRVVADRQLLGQAIDKLLDNAWKFTAVRDPARIEIGTAEGGGQPTYFVRDNGMGFDMRWAGKLFTTFQRLHEDSGLPGFGVGLAAVQRIIHRHGGRVWAEGAPGSGACFYFTLGDGLDREAPPA